MIKRLKKMHLEKNFWKKKKKLRFWFKIFFFSKIRAKMYIVNHRFCLFFFSFSKNMEKMSLVMPNWPYHHVHKCQCTSSLQKNMRKNCTISSICSSMVQERSFVWTFFKKNPNAHFLKNWSEFYFPIISNTLLQSSNLQRFLYPLLFSSFFALWAIRSKKLAYFYLNLL